MIIGADDPLVFIKTHKVGGTSLRLMLESLAARHGANILCPYGAGEGSSLKPYRRRRMDEVLGPHYQPAEVFADLSPPYHFSGTHLAYDRRFFDYAVPRARFVTWVRDPFERAVSHYYYHGGEDFEAWYGAHHQDPELLFAADNTRVNNYLCWWLGFDIDAPLSAAMLEERFTLVGIQERFAASVAVLGRLLGWPPQDLVFGIERKSRWRDRKPISQEIRTLFTQINARDYQLFELAGVLLDDKLERFLPSITADIEFLESNIQASRI